MFYVRDAGLSSIFLFVLISLNACGGGSDATSVDTIPPSVPAGLTGTAIDGGVSLNWAAATDADNTVASYRIYRNDSAAVLTEVTDVNHTDTTVSASTTYSYQVSAVDSEGNESALSSTFSITSLAIPDTTPPSVPDALTGMATTTQVSLSWNSATDAESGVAAYRIYRDGVALIDVTTPGYTDNSVLINTTYTYRVLAINGDGIESALSAPFTTNTGGGLSVSLPTTIWQIGSSREEASNFIVTDAQGNVYIAGYTKGDADGAGPDVNRGGTDTWVAKYSADGVQQWARQFGSYDSANWDSPIRLMLDSANNVLLMMLASGDINGPDVLPDPAPSPTNRTYLVKLSNAGVTQLVKILDVEPELIPAGGIFTQHSIVIDSSDNLYFIGSTNFDMDAAGTETHFGGYDYYAYKFDANGDPSWFRQFGTTSDDYAWAAEFDTNTNNLVFAGWVNEAGIGTPTDVLIAPVSTNGDMLPVLKFGDLGINENARFFKITNSGDYVVFGSLAISSDSSVPEVGVLRKYTRSGLELWHRTLAPVSNYFTLSAGIEINSNGEILLAGATSSNLGRNIDWTTNHRYDAYITKLSAAGEIQFHKQLGVALSNDAIRDFALDSAGNIYATGTTLGDLDGSGPQVHSGSIDAFIWRVSANASGGERLDGPGPDILQRGTEFHDTARATALGTGNQVIVAGWTSGDLDGVLTGRYLGGVGDAYVMSFNSSNDVNWIRQFGTIGQDEAFDVATDIEGNTYTVGFTMWNLAYSDAHVGGADMFIIKHSSTGDRRWVKQIGTLGDDVATSVSVDYDGTVYVGGYTTGDIDDSGSVFGGKDAFIITFNAADGAEIQRTQFGTANDDEVKDIAAGWDVVWATGYTDGDISGATRGNDWKGGRDMFIAQLQYQYGTIREIQNIGTIADDEGVSITLRGLEVYAVGNTLGDMDDAGPLTNVGGNDIFIIRNFERIPNSNDNVIAQFGTSMEDHAHGISIDVESNINVAGSTTGDIDGAGPEQTYGFEDIFIAKFNYDGGLVMTQQIGTPLMLSPDYGYDIVSDFLGNSFITGITWDDLDGAGPQIDFQGHEDLFLLRYGVSLE